MFRFLRFLHCRGCGTEFQTNFPNHYGFQDLKALSSKPSIRAKNQQSLGTIYNSLSKTQEQALDFLPPEVGLDPRSSAQVLSEAKSRQKAEKFKTFCRPCIDIKEGRSTPLSLPKLQAIPSNARVVHVLDAFDFPASFHVAPAEAKNPAFHYVLARADLVVNHKNQLSRLKEYAMKSVFDSMGVPASQVHVASAAKKWGLDEVRQICGPHTFFIGTASTGKSSLVAALDAVAQNTVWPVPYQTQQAVALRIGSKTLVDMPSLPEHGADRVLSSVKPKHVRELTAGKMMLRKNGRYNAEPTTAKPGQVVSIGGLVAIEVPKSNNRNAVHIWSVHGGPPQSTRALSTVKKIPEISSSTDPRHKNWSLVGSNEPFVYRFNVDTADEVCLVVRGVGPVFIRAFGQYDSPHELKVWSLPGVNVYERPPIMPWISHRPSKRTV